MVNKMYCRRRLGFMRWRMRRLMKCKVKLDIVKWLMTFPNGILTTDGEVIVHQHAVDEYEAWHKKIHQQIGFLDEYHSLIDENILEVLS